MRPISLHSRRKLKPIDSLRFAEAKPALFAELAQVICHTGMLPQKELHECWQMAERVHQAFPHVPRVADLAAGHGLLAWILVLLARKGENPLPRTAVAVDIRRPKSADRLAAALVEHWPELAHSVHYVEGSIDAVTADGPETLFVAAHACGSLSDRVLIAAIKSQSPVAIMPCCHSLRKQGPSLAALAEISGEDAPLVSQVAAIDAFRIAALHALHYEISEDSIQPEITSFHRIILGKITQTGERCTPAPAPSIKRLGDSCTPAPAPSCTPAPVPSIKRLGERRAYEKIAAFNVAAIEEAQTLAGRPSRTWLRSFDLSFWVAHEWVGDQLLQTIDTRVRTILGPISCTSVISLCDQYVDPATQRRAFTYRIEWMSSTQAITKDDALSLRKELCIQLDTLPDIERRG